MTVYKAYLDNFNNDNPRVRKLANIGNKNYVLECFWSNYSNCAYMTIKDDSEESIVNNIALVNGLVIRSKDIPYPIYFKHKDNQTYEPSLEDIATDFIITFDDEEEV